MRTAQRACGAVDVCRTRFATALVDVSLESGPTIPAASSDSPAGAAVADGLQPMDVDSADGGEAQGDAAAVVSEELLTLYTQRLYEPATSAFGQASVCEGGRRPAWGAWRSNILFVAIHSRGQCGGHHALPART